MSPSHCWVNLVHTMTTGVKLRHWESVTTRHEHSAGPLCQWVDLHTAASNKPLKRGLHSLRTTSSWTRTWESHEHWHYIINKVTSLSLCISLSRLLYLQKQHIYSTLWTSAHMLTTGLYTGFNTFTVTLRHWVHTWVHSVHVWPQLLTEEELKQTVTYRNIKFEPAPALTLWHSFHKLLSQHLFHRFVFTLFVGSSSSTSRFSRRLLWVCRWVWESRGSSLSSLE